VIPFCRRRWPLYHVLVDAPRSRAVSHVRHFGALRRACSGRSPHPHARRTQLESGKFVYYCRPLRAARRRRGRSRPWPGRRSGRFASARNASKLRTAGSGGQRQHKALGVGRTVRAGLSHGTTIASIGGAATAKASTIASHVAVV